MPFVLFCGYFFFFFFLVCSSCAFFGQFFLCLFVANLAFWGSNPGGNEHAHRCVPVPKPRCDGTDLPERRSFRSTEANTVLVTPPQPDEIPFRDPYRNQGRKRFLPWFQRSFPYRVPHASRSNSA